MQQNTKTYLILAALWLLMFASSSQFFIMAPILSEVGEQLNIKEGVRGTLITSYAFSLGLFALIIGPISDKIGRRKILLWGSGAMTVSLAMHFLAHDYFSMLTIRSIAGMSGGILTGSCVAYIGDYFPIQRRGWANGVIATGSAAGQIIGIPIGTIMADVYGFASPFLLFAGVMVIAFFGIRLFVPQPSVVRNTNRITVAKVVHEYGRMLRNRKMLATAGGYFLAFLSITVYIVYLPTWLEDEFCASSHEIAMLFLVGGLATIIGGPLSGRLADNRGRKTVLIAASIGLAAIMAMTTLILYRNMTSAYFLFFTLMLMISSRMIPFQALASDITPGHTRGKLMCLTIAIGQLGMGLGSAIAGFTYTSFGFIGNSLIGATAVILMAILVWRLIPETHEAPIEEEAALERA
ncbi:MAG: MFS transporter [Bacteroidota bacterium]